jgi:RimJ/RimL family protein N-acetyltransferase
MTVVPTGWISPLPVLTCADVTLRELDASDAESLHRAIAGDGPREFIPPPPRTVDGFARFIAFNRRAREEGRGGCFGVIPTGADGPRGLFQLTVVERDPLAIEWGFILTQSQWGTGLFETSATMVLDFLFNEYGAIRVQGRCAVENVRAIAALRKLGAEAGAIAYESTYFDRPREGQTLTLRADAWRALTNRATAVRGGSDVDHGTRRDCAARDVARPVAGASVVRTGVRESVRHGGADRSVHTHAHTQDQRQHDAGD